MVFLCVCVCVCVCVFFGLSDCVLFLLKQVAGGMEVGRERATEVVAEMLRVVDGIHMILLVKALPLDEVVLVDLEFGAGRVLG